MIEPIVPAEPSAQTIEPLAPEALETLVRGLVETPDAWAPRVRHDRCERHFELLWRDERVGVWLICWSGADHDTGFHDHDDRAAPARRRGRSPCRHRTFTGCTGWGCGRPYRSTPARRPSSHELGAPVTAWSTGRRRGGRAPVDRADHGDRSSTEVI